VITPRQTRLIRVADLHQFRRVIVALCSGPPAAGRVVIVPTRAAGSTLTRTLDTHGVRGKTLPALATRDELYDILRDRSVDARRQLTPFERDAIAQAAAHEAAAESGDLPFSVRPGLVAEILRFYDQLRRQSQVVRRFEELMAETLGREHPEDRGAERLLRQTMFLARTFRKYEERIAAAGAVDEHALRDTLIEQASPSPIQHVVVTVPDWIADPSGLFVADFDLLNRLPHLARIDVVATEGTLASGFHERLHTWWPGLDELTALDIVGPSPVRRPTLICPEPSSPGGESALWFTRRDREEELIAIARRMAGRDRESLSRTAVVFKRPLPYLYLAGETLGAAGVPYTAADAFPLAAEPTAAVLDLVLDVIEADYARGPLLELLRSPHLDFSASLSSEATSGLDHALSDARYLGQPDRLFELAEEWTAVTGSGARGPTVAVRQRALPAMRRAIEMVRELATIVPAGTASHQMRALIAFLEGHFTPLTSDDSLASRESRARAGLLRVLHAVADAHALHHDPPWSIVDLATGVRRWIADETFRIDHPSEGVHLLDDQAARYGEFDDVTVVGLIESDWPDRTRRNVFYPPSLLRTLNWPSEKDRRAAADARFLDVLSSSAGQVELSTFLLDDESIVARSIQLDEVARARLSTATRSVEVRRISDTTTRSIAPSHPSGTWLALRKSRTAAADPIFHGQSRAPDVREWSVSAVETYLDCPFKFFARHVLRLEEEPDDEEVMNPRRQGDFVHKVFETFFKEWQAAGHQAITPGNLSTARELFTTVVDRAIDTHGLPEGEASLERTRLLGSPVMAGLGEAVFRMEAERDEPVVARLLEHRLSGAIALHTNTGPRTVALRGKADRIDLLADGTIRLIDYKLGWAPDRTRALQLPIYAVAAEQRLRERGRSWTLGEAMYIAFKEPRRVVPLFSRKTARDDVLAAAQQRLADALDGIERGEFPPTPQDVFRCESCACSTVCRKDYVGDI
jgi:RecB family exonuclease